MDENKIEFHPPPTCAKPWYRSRVEVNLDGLFSLEPGIIGRDTLPKGRSLFVGPK